MYLYVASQTPLGGELPRCEHATEEEVCLATSPPKGKGGKLYRINISAQLIRKHAIRSEVHHCGPNRFVHLPRTIAESFPKTEIPWKEPWNVFEVTLLDGYEGANIWISRLGICRSNWIAEGKSLRLVLTESFDPAIDWVVVEYLNPPKWELACLAGKEPYWTIFPRLWRSWVQDPLVRQSAMRFIVNKYPDLKSMVTAADEATRRSEQISGWLHVAERIAEDPEIGPILFYGYSATKISYMPLRIAQRLGWVPPINKPKPADLEKEDRSLLATLGKVKKEEEREIDLEQYTA